MPKRATVGSAGYDFKLPFSITLNPNETKKIPTGIRVQMEVNYVLKLYPRSGLGFKYRLQLNNTVGIIDSDYYYSDNEGHIFAKITNDSNENKEICFPYLCVKTMIDDEGDRMVEKFTKDLWYYAISDGVIMDNLGSHVTLTSEQVNEYFKRNQKK